MRIALVTETYPPEVNGVALTVQALAQELRALGHAVAVVRPRQPGADVPVIGDVLVAGAALPRYPGLRFGLPARRRLESLWREAPPDAVYVATEGPLGGSALRAARRLRIPVATGFHTRFDDYAARYAAPWLKPLVLRLMCNFHNRGAATIVPTRQLADELAACGFERVRVLQRGVDTQRFDPRRRDRGLRRTWGVDDAGLAVLHVGRLAREKNLGLVVRAFRALSVLRPDARLVFVGEGPERAALQEAHPDVVFAGLQRDVALAAHFASGDLFLFPSLSETFGNVTLEAMASGVATVAYDYGAAREHLADGEHGARVRCGDAARFVDAAMHLARDDARRVACGRAARRAAERLGASHVAQGFARLLAALGTTA